MNIIRPKFEELKSDNPLKLGELCTRVCYKSEDHITDGSAKKLLTAIANNGHTAMLEHVSVYLKVNFGMQSIFADVHKYDRKEYYKVASSPYTIVNTDMTTGNIYISTNLRVLFENYPDLYNVYMDNDGKKFTYQAIYENCAYDEDSIHFVRRITIKFTMDRIGSQSFCRHRVFSFAQESTRFVNYLREKFGSEISIILPCWLKEEDYDEFTEDMKLYEQLYFKWLNKGYKAEEARAFLSFDVKTEIIMTGFPSAWEHFFSLRTEQHAHSQARELAIPLEEYFKEHGYLDYFKQN